MVEVCAEAREKDYDAGFQPVIAAVNCNRKMVASYAREIVWLAQAAGNAFRQFDSDVRH